MSSFSSNLPLKTVWVHTLRYEADGVLGVVLHPMKGESLPAYEPGAHVDIHLPDGWVRCYSLCGEEGVASYAIAVLLEPKGRGGSKALHEQLRIGMQLQISPPRNHFPLQIAEHTVLIAGGIGVTPLLAMARRLKRLGSSFEWIYCARSPATAAFVSEIKGMGVPVHWHFDSEQGQIADLHSLLVKVQQRGGEQRWYACGPAPMLDSFLQISTLLGQNHAHIERFAAETTPTPPRYPELSCRMSS